MAISINVPITAADIAALQAGNQLDLVLVPPAVASSTPPAAPVPVPSSNLSLIEVGSTATLTGIDGTVWGLPADGVVTVNGTPDPTTSNVEELAYVNGLIWQRNQAGLWFSKKVPSDTWSPVGGTTVDPETVAPTPTPAPTPVGPPPPVLKVVIAQNGQVNPTWTQDYTYAAVDAKAQPGDGYGNPNGIKVTTTAPWGGFLPSNPPGHSTDFSACTELTVAINAPKGYTYEMYAILGGDSPINAPGFTFTKTVNGWEVFTTPKAAVMTDATKGDVSASILKACIQSKQGTTGDTFEIDNFGGI